MSERHPSDVVGHDGRVRVLLHRCGTCIFRPGAPMGLSLADFEEIVRRNVDAGALLTCHATLPYGAHPDFGPAVCAGFWARHGMETAAGRLARFLLGITRIAPPGDGMAAVRAGGASREEHPHSRSRPEA